MSVYEVRNRLDNSLIIKGSMREITELLGCSKTAMLNAINKDRPLGYIMTVTRISRKRRTNNPRSKYKYSLYHNGNLVRRNATAKQLADQLKVPVYTIYNTCKYRSYYLGVYTVVREMEDRE